MNASFPVLLLTPKRSSKNPIGTVANSVSRAAGPIASLGAGDGAISLSANPQQPLRPLFVLTSRVVGFATMVRS